MRGFFSATAMVVAAAAILALPHLAGSAAAQAVPQSRAEITFSFAPIVKRVAPAVVNVYARRMVRQPGFMPFGDDPLFRHFFGDDGLFGSPRERVQNSLGSGVIVDDSGFIVTNNHVIKGGTDIRIVLSDKREFEAKVLLNDERTDLAVLKIESGDGLLPTLPLGDSDGLEVGDLVLAIGNPFGVGQTVTSGIVSALARTEIGITDYQFFVQTDAAINPGNSGGALVDMSGRLVGINTAIFSRSGGSIGIGFAIPVNMVKAVIRSSVATGRVVRPWSGAEIQEVTVDIAQTLGLDRPVGALVSDLHRLSPLLKAGIRRGDVIVALNGKSIDNSREFNYRLATAPVGRTARIAYARGGKRYAADVRLIAPPENPPREETLVQGRSPFAGLVVANLSPAVAEELGLRVSAKGVVVLDVRGGPAARIGFRKGDVLVEVNGVAVERVRTLAELVDRRGTGLWEIAVERGGSLLRMQIAG
ncbi:MAG TPA: DegQ family serine endoprotease [Aestuariivirgaceae bacterium]|nr:DegQ family serine endoprotease [Aestuariivirgaceae bacterium]